MLEEVVNNHLPSTWARASYNDARYRLVDLSPADAEYAKVAAGFAGLAVSRVQRVQNPYVFGRFAIKREYLALTGYTHKSTAYHPVAADEKEKVAEYNCDYRRYNAANAAQSANKKPRFYSTARDALENMRAYSPRSEVCIVVVELLNADAAWDSHYFPAYFVNVS